jgi:hypothetical protein
VVSPPRDASRRLRSGIPHPAPPSSRRSRPHRRGAPPARMERPDHDVHRCQRRRPGGSARSRTRYRNSPSTPELLEPHEVYEITGAGGVLEPVSLEKSPLQVKPAVRSIGTPHAHCAPLFVHPNTTEPAQTPGCYIWMYTGPEAARFDCGWKQGEKRGGSSTDTSDRPVVAGLMTMVVPSASAAPPGYYQPRTVLGCFRVGVSIVGGPGYPGQRTGFLHGHLGSSSSTGCGVKFPAHGAAEFVPALLKFGEAFAFESVGDVLVVDA